MNEGLDFGCAVGEEVVAVAEGHSIVEAVGKLEGPGLQEVGRVPDEVQVEERLEEYTVAGMRHFEVDMGDMSPEEGEEGEVALQEEGVERVAQVSAVAAVANFADQYHNRNSHTKQTVQVSAEQQQLVLAERQPTGYYRHQAVQQLQPNSCSPVAQVEVEEDQVARAAAEECMTEEVQRKDFCASCRQVYADYQRSKVRLQTEEFGSSDGRRRGFWMKEDETKDCHSYSREPRLIFKRRSNFAILLSPIGTPPFNITLFFDHSTTVTMFPSDNVQF